MSTGAGGSAGAGVRSQRLVDRMRPKVPGHHLEEVPGLRLPRLWQLEEPDRHDAHPRPLLARPLEGADRVGRLKTLADGAVWLWAAVAGRRGVPADLGGPDRAGGIPVLDHQLADHQRPREVDVAAGEAQVVRTAPEAVRLDRQHVEGA